jgi:hypothetical protein
MSKWQAILRDGKTIDEPSDQGESAKIWKDIRIDVCGLNLVCDDLVITLPRNMFSYEQSKTGSAALGGGEIILESRWIGFMTETGQILKVRFHEREKKISIELD